EDEWHAVYRVVHDAPAAIFLDFAHSDSSIPLTLLYALESRRFGLSEIGMRLPLVLAGAATLILFPWYAARHVGPSEALVFAALLAISPLLYFFSRTARPYALTLLLPPLFVHPESLRLKGGLDLPHADTLIGVWYLWFGTGATAAVLICGALALLGARAVWQRLLEAKSAVAGIALTAIAIVITRPAWIQNPL